MEVLFAIAGLIMIYSTGHFLFIQHKKANKDRTSYEKVVSVVAIVSIVLLYLGVMVGK